MTTKQMMEVFFQRHAKSTRMWEVYAVTLRYAMEVVFRQEIADSAAPGFRHRRRKSLRAPLYMPALMLTGMMLEAYAKAVLISQRIAIKARKFRGHDLVAILTATGCSLTNEEQYFLKRLSQFVQWAGRYPAPTKPSGMAVKNPRGDLEMVLWSNIGAELKQAREIADRLEALLPGNRVRTGMRLPSGRAKSSRQKRRAGK